jgi:predicted nucleotidyltransferase
MRREEILAVLREHREELRRLGARSIAIFGSAARDEARPDSDVDVLVELEEGIGFFGFAHLQRYLQEILGSPVDLVTPDALKRQMRDEILAEAIRAA